MSVIKHKYISAREPQSRVAGKTPKVAAIGRALAHVKYIQHRPGPDRDEKEKDGRDLFDGSNDKVDAKDFRKLIKAQGDSKVIAHKLILAPEINPEDPKLFAREVMDKIAREKGLNLVWVGTTHSNTDHHHVHVMVLGKDANGKDVRFDRKDHDRLREYSDRYLERVHPIELEKSRTAREIKERDRRDGLVKDRVLLREERVLEGIELPWMHQKIVREQIEPFKEWDQKQDKKERAAPKKEAVKEPEVPEFNDRIEAAGKDWTKANTLQELRDLNQHLWDNYQDRLPLAEYKKLIGWIRDKEQVAREPEPDGPLTAAGKEWTKENSLAELKALDERLLENFSERIPNSEYKKLHTWIKDKERKEKESSHSKEQAPEQEQTKSKDKNSFEYGGETYKKDSSYEHLSELNKKLREEKAERLPIDDYQKLRRWTERADRSRWAGALDNHATDVQKKMDKEQAQSIEHGTRAVNPAQQELLGNPVIGIFLKVASVANELVKMAPARDLHDPLNEAHRQMTTAHINTKEKLARPGRTPGADLYKQRDA